MWPLSEWITTKLITLHPIRQSALLTHLDTTHVPLLQVPLCSEWSPGQGHMPTAPTKGLITLKGSSPRPHTSPSVTSLITGMIRSALITYLPASHIEPKGQPCEEYFAVNTQQKVFSAKASRRCQSSCPLCCSQQIWWHGSEQVEYL